MSYENAIVGGNINDILVNGVYTPLNCTMVQNNFYIVVGRAVFVS